MVEGHTNWTTMFLQIMFLICSVCNTYGVASSASPSCASDEYRAGQVCCLACAGGYKVHQDCTVTTNTLCSKCPDGTFKEGLSGQKQCSACTKCGTGYRVIRDCTTTTNTLCSKCPDGTFEEDLSGQKQCSACTKCGTGLKVKKKCTSTSDAECEVLDGFFCSDSADKDTFSDATLSCQPHTICDSGVQIKPGTDSTDSTCIKYVAIVFIIIGCILFIILLVLGALALVYRRHLKKKKKLELDTELTDLDKQIREAETSQQYTECYNMYCRLLEKKKTTEQRRKLNRLARQYNEKWTTLDMNRELTDLDKRIREAETRDHLTECRNMYFRLLSRKKTQEQEGKLKGLAGQYIKKKKTLELDRQLTEKAKQRHEKETWDQLECSEKAKQRHEKETWDQLECSEVIDRLLEKKTTQEQEKWKELIDLLWEKWEELNVEFTDESDGDETSDPSSTSLLSTEPPAGLETSSPPVPSSETQPDEELAKLSLERKKKTQEPNRELNGGAAGEETSDLPSTPLLSTEPPAGLETSSPPAPSSETQPDAETTALMSSDSPAPTGDQQEHTSRTTTPDATMDDHDDDQRLDACRSGTGQQDIEMGPVQTLR